MHFKLIWNMVLYSGMNYRIKGFEVVNEIQGGNLNVHGEKWHPSLGIGSIHWVGHSHPCCLCSTATRCNGVHIRWLNRYVNSLVWKHQFLV